MIGRLYWSTITYHYVSQSLKEDKETIKVKVNHIIASLQVGGANIMLQNLVSCMDREIFETEVFSLTDIGPIGQNILALGVPVRAVGMHRGVPNPFAVLKLANWLRQKSPDVIQTWGYHADLIGGLAAKLSGGFPVYWGIHHTTFDPKGTKRLSLWTAMVCARLSNWLPTRIVCCSEASLRLHGQRGYPIDKMLVIANGFDLTKFKPDLAARKSVRQELSIPNEAPLIGLVARFDPQKDHHNFIKAAARFHDFAPDCHFLLCGDDITWKNSELVGWINQANIRNSCHLLGRREDIPRLTAALDIASTASYSESFPLVIGEAMACGVPCVVTDVGDSASIVSETGVVVEPRDSQALASGWSQLLLGKSREERAQIGLVARQKIKENYDLVKIVETYENLYRGNAIGAQSLVN